MLLVIERSWALPLVTMTVSQMLISSIFARTIFEPIKTKISTVCADFRIIIVICKPVLQSFMKILKT